MYDRKNQEIKEEMDACKKKCEGDFEEKDEVVKGQIKTATEAIAKAKEVLSEGVKVFLQTSRTTALAGSVCINFSSIEHSVGNMAVSGESGAHCAMEKSGDGSVEGPRLGLDVYLLDLPCAGGRRALALARRTWPSARRP